ncbi:hypothetical protein [Butyricicoccus sp.]|uniref:hypothetical protein n=1 Tax=Butyricicoccus sp. TaxID=2049021 RepID=UPI002E9B013D|nr:hypothetical protein [Butyricicoccus sp.]
MNKSQKKSWLVGAVLLLALLAVMGYAFGIQPAQQKQQRLESYRTELYSTMQIGMDLCGDRIDRTDAATFSEVRDKFRMHQGMLLAQYTMAYDDMSVYDTPNALLLLGEYSGARDIPADYTAYREDSADPTGQFLFLSTSILYDALGSDSQSMEDVLKEIEADERTGKAVAMIK